MDDYFKSLPLYKKVGYIVVGAFFFFPIFLIAVVTVLITSLRGLCEKLFKIGK